MAKKKPLPANPVTPQDADGFDLLIRKWQDALNLNDWRIEKSPKPSRKHLAEVTSMALSDRLAIYKLGTDFGDTKPVTAQSMEEVACHEVLHILLHELIEFSKDAKSQASDLDAAEHRVIHTLVRLLVPVQ